MPSAGEFYLAGYELSAETRREIEPLRLAAASEVQARQQAGGLLIGPEVTNWFPGSRVLFPRAATLGQLARGRTGLCRRRKPATDLPARNPLRQGPTPAHPAGVKMQKGEWRTQNLGLTRALKCRLPAFCILHSSFCLRPGVA